MILHYFLNKKPKCIIQLLCYIKCDRKNILNFFKGIVKTRCYIMIKKSGSLLFFVSYYRQTCSQIVINKLKYLIAKKKWSFKNNLLDSAIQKEAVQYAKSITGPFKNLKCRSKRWSHDKKFPLSKPVSITNQMATNYN